MVWRRRARRETRRSGWWTWLGVTLLVVAAFFAALVAIRFLLRFVAKHSFAGFAYYRIALGVLILVSWQLGWVRW